MSLNYQVKGATGTISMSVTVGTTAVTHTVVSMKVKGGTGFKTVGASGQSSGNIPNITLGDARDLAGATIVVRILQDLSNIEPGNQPQAVSTTNIRYTFEGGTDDDQVFEPTFDETPINQFVNYLSIITLS